MSAITPDMPRAALIRQDPGRPHVPDTRRNGRAPSIMHDAPDIRIPAPRRPEPQHKPWCSVHIAGVDVDDFGTCMSSDIDCPGQAIALTCHPGEAVEVSLCTGDRMEVLSLDELEQRALAMLTTALIGRGATPPASAFAAATSWLPPPPCSTLPDPSHQDKGIRS